MYYHFIIIIIQMFYLLFGLIAWVYYGTKLYDKTNKNFDIATLFNSVTHASIVVLSYLIGIPGTVIYYITISYYIIDTCYELISLIPFKSEKPLKFRLYNLGILIHHVLIIYSIKYITDELSGKYIFYAFYLAELSNFPMYAVQYLKKTKYQNQIVVNLLVILEIIAYTYLRLYLCGYQSYLLLFVPGIPITVILTSWAMIIISAFWTYKLVMQIYGNKHKQEVVNEHKQNEEKVGSQKVVSLSQ